jgi:DNA polymerase III psi subunit
MSRSLDLKKRKVLILHFKTVDFKSPASDTKAWYTGYTESYVHTTYHVIKNDTYRSIYIKSLFDFKLSPCSECCMLSSG